MEEKKKKKFLIKLLLIGAALILFAAIGIYIFLTHRTYNNIRVLNTVTLERDNGEKYAEFADGILKYSKDGVALLDRKGKERWNFSYQMQNPVVSVSEKSAVIADKGANDLVVLQSKGVKGEIHTSLPVEKAEVSRQGIVSAILRDGVSAKIVCYDAEGNLLVEHVTSPTTTGYPLDAAISDDGYTLLVSYLFIEQGKMTTKVAYYSFDEKTEKKENHLIMEEKYENTIAPSVFFLDNETSAVVSDNQLHIYEGKEKTKKKQTVQIKEQIQNVFHDDEYIGMLLKNEKNYIVKLYDKNGKELLSKTVEQEYKNVKVEDGQVIMYDGKKCQILTKAGVRLFDGEMENDIANIISVFGVNKYLVINANGLEEIRLAN